jgi:serine/threonine-protein kinase
MMAHQFKAPTSLKELAPSVPDELVEVIERLMQKKPEDRFGSADEAADRLLPLTGGRPVNGALPETATAAPVYTPRPSSFVPPPAPKPTRPSSFVLPPPNGAPTASQPAGPLFPTPLPYPQRQSSPAFANGSDHAAPALRDDTGERHPVDDRPFTMPPGYVPDAPRGRQFSTIAVAVVGLGAMIVSYLTFLSFNPFK